MIAWASVQLLPLYSTGVHLTGADLTGDVPENISKYTFCGQILESISKASQLLGAGRSLFLGSRI